MVSSFRFSGSKEKTLVWERKGEYFIFILFSLSLFFFWLKDFCFSENVQVKQFRDERDSI